MRVCSEQPVTGLCGNVIEIEPGGHRRTARPAAPRAKRTAQQRVVEIGRRRRNLPPASHDRNAAFELLEGDEHAHVAELPERPLETVCCDERSDVAKFAARDLEQLAIRATRETEDALLEEAQEAILTPFEPAPYRLGRLVQGHGVCQELTQPPGKAPVHAEFRE